MRSKFFCAAVLALLLSFVSARVFAQANYAYEENHTRYTVGAGISGFDMDWGHGIMYGPTLWADWNPPFMPGFLHGLSVEMTARDISWNHSSTQPSDFRTDTLGGGFIYHHRVPYLRRVRPLEPYIKGEWYFGSVDHKFENTLNPTTQPYNHETRTVTALAGGFDYHLPHHLIARADYEYQFWPDFLGRSGKDLNPTGLTLGVLYGFGGRAR